MTICSLLSSEQTTAIKVQFAGLEIIDEILIVEKSSAPLATRATAPPRKCRQFRTKDRDAVLATRFLADRGSGNGASRTNAGFPPALVASTQEYLWSDHFRKRSRCSRVGARYRSCIRQ